MALEAAAELVRRRYVWKFRRRTSIKRKRAFSARRFALRTLSPVPCPTNTSMPLRASLRPHSKTATSKMSRKGEGIYDV